MALFIKNILIYWRHYTHSKIFNAHLKTVIKFVSNCSLFTLNSDEIIIFWMRPDKSKIGTNREWFKMNIRKKVEKEDLIKMFHFNNK